MKQPGWAIITGEYPPQRGGVADYTAQVARGLADAGDEVHVFAPACAGSADQTPSSVHVHRLPDHYGPGGLWWLSRQLDRAPGRRILVQYVPHAYGCKAMNVFFALWLRRRARRDEVWIQFHEVAYPYERGQPLRHRFLAWVTHRMAACVAGNARRLFMTTPAWAPLIRAGAGDVMPVSWLAAPSNLPVSVDADKVKRLREDIIADKPCFGHFGTYGSAIAAMLNSVLPEILQSNPDSMALLIGRGGEAFAGRLLQQHPTLHGRITATGGLDPETAAAHIAACDVMVQPYPDGVTCRRGTLMAALALGRAIATTAGPRTEAFWHDSGALTLAPMAQPGQMVEQALHLMRSPEVRKRLGERAEALYARQFAVERTITALREPDGPGRETITPPAEHTSGEVQP